ncbi:MAG TPA: ABC transporter ATP-binding protein, partial [Thermoleophilaceae bacterium]|nr:ABC transporter ATP-binding protein [Thermoleophilaceae bacterium]
SRERRVSLLEVRDLDVRHGLLQAVRGVSFSVDKGQTLALVGANGAGKSTLLRAVAGAPPRPSGGRIVFDGEDITRVRAHSRVKRGIALVPEGRLLFPSLTVEENLLVAARPGDWNVGAVMEAFPMLQGRRKHRAGTLSGGERQAAAIGRALMSNPRLLLLDEVSLGLAPVAVEDVYRSLATVIESGTAVLLVEQDLTRALDTAERVVCILEGRVVLAGSASEVTRDQVTEAYFGLAHGNGARA